MKPVCPISSSGTKGTVTLVALCFVTVLGITLAGYIAVCSRAMTLSNRSSQTRTSQQLAEMGIDEAMRAFNKNDWTGWASNPGNVTGATTAWTLDATNHRASRTITFNSPKLGQGVTGTVKIRIDNYDATQLGSTWSSSITYRINDLVGYSGTWYRSVQNSNSSHPPGDLAWWVPAPIPWTWSSNITYSQYDVVNYNGTWYRYFNSLAPNGNNPSTDITRWETIPALSLSWSSSTAYTLGTVLFYNGDWYYCISSVTSSSTPAVDTSHWAKFLDSFGSAVTPSSTRGSFSYAVGDYIYRTAGGGNWYRCTMPYTDSGGPFSSVSSKWSVSSPPNISWAWQSAPTPYKFNDVVFSSGGGMGGVAWYRCKTAAVFSATTPNSDPANWENALSGTNATTSPGPLGWSSSSINYNLGDTVYYSGTSQRYRCIRAHTSSGTYTPNSATYPYWTTTPLYSTAWDSNRQYGQNDTVRYNGVWYLSLQNSNVAQNPVTATTYWIGANTATTSYHWNATTAYSVGDYRCYGGGWYKCTTAHTGHSPNDTSYWTPTWANSFGVTTGAPVVYAEGTITIANNPPARTQLRATIAPAPLFPNAAGATNTINASSGGTVDSYDGSVFRMDTAAVPGTAGTYSTYTYNQTSSPFSVGSPNLGYSAVLAAGNTAATAVTLSGAITVSGYVAAPSASSPSPYAPLFSYGTSAVVKGTSATPSPKVDLSRVSRSPSIPQFDPLPSGGLTAAFSAANFPRGLALPATLPSTLNLGTPGATTRSRYYSSGDLTLTSNLVINGPVILYVNGKLILNSGGMITINSTGSAEIHIADSLQVNSTSTGFYNLTLDPKKLILISDTTGSSVQNYSSSGNGPAGNNPFYGVIYMPNTTNSSGLLIDNTNLQINGALSAKTITYSGADMNVHYDTSLRYATFGGLDQPYSVTDWRELPVDEQATMP